MSLDDSLMLFCWVNQAAGSAVGLVRIWTHVGAMAQLATGRASPVLVLMDVRIRVDGTLIVKVVRDSAS